MKREARSSKSTTAPWELFVGVFFEVAGEGREKEGKVIRSNSLNPNKLFAMTSSLLLCTNLGSRENFFQ